jgi:hypothetical protein
VCLRNTEHQNRQFWNLLRSPRAVTSGFTTRRIVRPCVFELRRFDFDRERRMALIVSLAGESRTPPRKLTSAVTSLQEGHFPNMLDSIRHAQDKKTSYGGWEGGVRQVGRITRESTGHLRNDAIRCFLVTSRVCSKRLPHSVIRRRIHRQRQDGFRLTMREPNVRLYPAWGYVLFPTPPPPHPDQLHGGPVQLMSSHAFISSTEVSSQLTVGWKFKKINIPGDFTACARHESGSILTEGRST